MIESNVDIGTAGVPNNPHESTGITFDMLQALKIEHGKIYEDANASNSNELLNYLYDILDNINSEIIKQNKQRIKAKYGSLLPPAAVRNNSRQPPGSDQESVGGADRDNDGFQPVMPKRSGRNGGGGMPNATGISSGSTGGRRGRDTKSGRLSGGASGGRSSSYSQPYRPESERTATAFSLNSRPPRVGLELSVDGTGKSSALESNTDGPKNGGSENGTVSTGLLLVAQSGATAFSLNSRPPGVGLEFNVNGTRPGGALSRLLAGGSGVDRVKMAINREMNKLSPVNMDIVVDSITDVFAGWLLEELNNDTPLDSIREKYQKYLLELWSNLIGKSLAQANMSEVYFKFLRKIMSQSATPGAQTIIICLRAKSPIMAGRLGTWQPGFHELVTNKNELLDEIIAFLKQADYFEGDSTTGLAEKVGGAENLTNIQQSFSILGLFAKYFMDAPSGRNRKAPSSWDIMLLAIYSNFKLLNELLYWEPVNLAEVERRVFFTVGFLEDNRGFIQSLDTDFYRDIECELDSIKKCASIPTSVKYKLFDCIDNFILMRKSGGSVNGGNGRK